MSSFEELLYTQHLEQQAEEEKNNINVEIYNLLQRKAEIDKEVEGVRELRKSLISDILIVNNGKKV